MSWAEIDVMSLKADGISMEEHYDQMAEEAGDDDPIEYIIEDPEAEDVPLVTPRDVVEQKQKEPVKMKHRRVTPEQQERMLELQGQGRTVMQIAQELGLRRTTVHEVLKRTNQMVKTNILKLRRMQKKKKKKPGKNKELLTDEQVDLINQWLDEDSLLSMATLVDRLKEQCGVTVSKSYISKVIDDFHYSLTRLTVDPRMHIKQDQKLVQARQSYAKALMDLHREYAEHQFVFVHFAEFTLVARTNATGDGTNERGAKRGIYNSVAVAMNRDKVLMYHFMFLAMESEDYCEFYKRLLERMTQEEGLEKAVIILDAELLGGAKGDVETAILEAGYQYLSVPRDSVFLNPVERLFSGWKAVTRRANAKDEKTLLKAITEGGDTLIKERDCKDCFTSFLSMMIYGYHGKWYDSQTMITSFAPVTE